MTFGDPRAYVRIANEIREQIRAGELKPGNPVSIKRLNQETGYSRKTISKALVLLEIEGMVMRYPGLGYLVLDTTQTEY